MRQSASRNPLGASARWSISAAALLAFALHPVRAAAGEVVLQDAGLLVAFDATSGTLTRLENKSTHWDIERQPELGASFRLHAPLPDRRDNFVLGGKQRAARVEKITERKVRIEWANLVSEHGGVLPIAFTAIVTLDGDSLSFDGKLVNNSPLTVESLEFPCLGDLSPPSRDSTLSRRNMFYANLESNPLYPRFQNDKGYWGVDFPTQSCGTNRSLFCLIQSEDQGIYAGMHESNPRYYLQYVFEERPGDLATSFDWAAPVPREESISGIPVHLEFHATHYLFAQPRSSVDLAPVVLRAYRGDWHGGVDCYKEWRASWFKAPHVPAWALDVHSWQQLQVNSPEEEYRVPYRDLPKVGAECAANGVGAIQLVGWNHGGQDRGNPSLDTDPGLGTWAELRDAIAETQAKGVKVILFGKFVWADITTDWYRSELRKFAIKDPYGDPYLYDGYSYHTPTQLAGINNRRFAMMCPLSAQWRDVATGEFRKVLALGAAGWLYDEVMHHGTALYCFDPGHGHPVPEYVYQGDAPMSEALHRAADAVNGDFLFAGEAPSDVLLQYYPFSYIRIRTDSVPIARYIDPAAPLMAAAAGFDDRETLNLVLMERYVISYEPYFFKGRLGDFPLTLSYGRKIDALRRRYRAWLWDAEFRDTLGATVHSDGACRYSVFRTAAGKRAVVVANMESEKAITAKVELSGPPAAGPVSVTPENPDAAATDGTLQIPARSVSVLLEQ